MELYCRQYWAPQEYLGLWRRQYWVPLEYLGLWRRQHWTPLEYLGLWRRPAVLGSTLMILEGMSAWGQS